MLSYCTGSSAQFFINWGYGWSVPWDSAAEAYYQIDGTDKKFHVQADWVGPAGTGEGRVFINHSDLETNDVPKGGLTNLGGSPVVNGNPIQWVLTGSEKYGYWTSNNPPVAWMQAIIDVIGDRKLKYICMPGSHDAGISRVVFRTVGADNGNTRTQGLDFYGQLLRGARWFDVRPCIGNHGEYFLCHYSKVGLNVHGGLGLFLDDMIDQINRYVYAQLVQSRDGNWSF
jgi:hypothetical protein